MKSRFTTSQIIKILRAAELSSATEVCRDNKISQNTFYKWKRKFGGMEVKDAQRLKSLEKENAELKKMYAESILQNRALTIALEKNG